MEFNFNVHSELIGVVEGSGRFYAKKGSMIADQGRFSYSKCMIGPATNNGRGGMNSLLGRAVGQVARKLTGENLQLMTVEGDGKVYLADQSLHVINVDLTNDNTGNTFYVESDNVLAFTDDCSYDVALMSTGIAQNDLFKTKFTCRGRSAQVLITSVGNPLVLTTPCRVDPDALLAWTGPMPSIAANIHGVFDGLKTLFGQSSGESYIYEFNQPGYVVFVQPTENKSKIGFSVDGSTGNNHDYNQYNR